MEAWKCGDPLIRSLSVLDSARPGEPNLFLGYLEGPPQPHGKAARSVLMPSPQRPLDAGAVAQGKCNSDSKSTRGHCSAKAPKEKWPWLTPKVLLLLPVYCRCYGRKWG